jgi:ornithine cyclodeaminase
VRFLRDEDVAALVSPADALAAVRASFDEAATGSAAVQPRVRTEAGGAKLSTLGAVLAGRGVLGAKVYATVDGQFTFLVALFAADDGRRLAVLESDALTRLRTAATSVLATEVLRAKPPGRLTVFGSGLQATGHVTAFADHWDLDEVTIVGREARSSVAAELAAATETPVRAVASDAAEAAVSAADVVVTATRSTTPVLRGEWLAPGAHVCAVGSSRPEAHELDADVYERAALVTVELRDQAEHEAGGLVDAVTAGVLAWDDVAELADIVSGAVVPREADGEVTVFQSVGIGLEDVAVAACAWEAAEAAGAGVVLT